MVVKQKESGSTSRSLFCLFVPARLQELEAYGHEELVLSGIVNIDIVEVEILAHGGAAQIVEDLAQTEVVVDVKRDAF